MIVDVGGGGTKARFQLQSYSEEEIFPSEFQSDNLVNHFRWRSTAEFFVFRTTLVVKSTN